MTTPHEILRADLPYAIDLRIEAMKALQRGELIRVERQPFHDNPSISVETLILMDCRAGQVTNGNAVWGDWDPETETIVLADPTEGLIVVYLNGREVKP